MIQWNQILERRISRYAFWISLALGVSPRKHWNQPEQTGNRPDNTSGSGKVIFTPEASCYENQSGDYEADQATDFKIKCLHLYLIVR
jgi:hypothetical protein